MILLLICVHAAVHLVGTCMHCPSQTLVTTRLRKPILKRQKPIGGHFGHQWAFPVSRLCKAQHWREPESPLLANLAANGLLVSIVCATPSNFLLFAPTRFELPLLESPMKSDKSISVDAHAIS